MYKISIILLLLFTLSFAQEEKYEYEGNMGYLVDGLDYIKYKDTRLAFDLWMQELANDQNVKTNIKYYDKVSSLIEDYKEFKIDYFSLNPYFFLKYSDVFYNLTTEFWMVKKSQERFQEYILLVREDSSIKHLKDLKNRSVLARSDDYMGKLILDAVLLKTLHTSSKKYLLEIAKSKSYSNTILQTYFKKYDACIVPSYALDIVVEMNPSVGKKLKILYKSEKIFMPIIAGFHKSAHVEVKQRFRNNVVNIQKSVRGQNILNLFKMKKLLQVSKEELKPLFRYYNEYITLKKKYAQEKN